MIGSSPRGPTDQFTIDDCPRFPRGAWRYLSSSAGVHATGGDPSGLLDMPMWLNTGRPARRKSELRCGADEASTAAIRLSTSRGRPLASDSFMSKLEHRLGGPVRASPVGRPKRRRSTRKRGAAGSKHPRKCVTVPISFYFFYVFLFIFRVDPKQEKIDASDVGKASTPYQQRLPWRSCGRCFAAPPRATTPQRDRSGEQWFHAQSPYSHDQARAIRSR